MPVADEVWRLQRGDDAESRFFQSFADRGHYRGKGGSRQGIYVVTPSGKLLAAANELNADRLCVMLEEALDSWNAMTPEQRRSGDLPVLASVGRWEALYPADGLVLVETLRDVPRNFEAGADRLQPSNRDHVWFSREECADLIGSDSAAALNFLRRLARFHLVDAVRGQSLPFAEEELQQLEMRVERTDSASDDDGVFRYRLSGSTDAVALGPWLMGQSDWTPNREYPRSVRTQLRGHAVWDSTDGRFTEFELIAIGSRTGFSQFNGRSEDRDRAPIGFHFKLAEPGQCIPPAFVDVYDAKWILGVAEGSN